MTCTLWTRWKQRIRLVGMVAFIVAGVLAGAHYHLLWSAEWDLRRAVREADQLDPSWRLQDLEARRDAIADPENSARKVTAVKMAMASRWPNLQRVSMGPGRSVLESDMEIDLGNQLGRLPPDMQLSPDVIQVFSGVMKYSARVLDRARDLVRYPQGRYAIEYPQNLRNLSPDSEQASIVANLLWADALLEAQKQKPDQA